MLALGRAVAFAIKKKKKRIAGETWEARAESYYRNTKKSELYLEIDPQQRKDNKRLMI